MNSIDLEEVLRCIHNLPSLPTAVMELLACLGQEDVNIDALARQIEQDQALTAKTLRIANSSFYGMSNQITTIHEAITILGFRTMYSLATTAALINTMSDQKRSEVNLAPFWRHGIATAVCARNLAPHLNLHPEYAYTAGLLHDIGRLVLVTQFASQYLAVMAYRSAHDCHLIDAERTVLGLDHATVGHALTKQWKFPEPIQQSVACHHAPACAGLPDLATVVQAANAIAHALDLSQDPNDQVPAIAAGLWQKLGLSDADLLAVFQDTEKQLDGAMLVLET